MNPAPPASPRPSRSKWRYLLILVVLIGAGVAVYAFNPRPHYKIVHNFSECADANYPVTESDPQSCHTPYGTTFTQETAAPNTAQDSVSALPFATLVVQNDGGPAKLERDVITSQAAWQAFWSRTYSKLSPVPNIIPVDFGQFELVAVMDGQKPTVGYTVEVTGVAQSSTKVVVTVRDSGPPKGCIATPTPMSPFHIIKIAKTALPVTYTADPNVTQTSCSVKSAAKTY